MCYQWIVLTGVSYCLADDFNLSIEEVSYILDGTSSDDDGNFVYNLNTYSSHLYSQFTPFLSLDFQLPSDPMGK